MTPRQFADAAEALLGTPFRLGGRDPAAGLDCVGVVAYALGGVDAPAGYALRNASIDRHLGFAARAGFASCDLPMARGDLILAIPGPAQHHLLVALGGARFVHAHAGLRRVALHEGPLRWLVQARWRLPQEGN